MGDTDSVYDDVLLNAARSPEVDPALFDEMCERTKEQEALAGKKLGHFRVIQRLGAGGMGIIYRAEDEVLRRPVALKVLSAWLANSKRSHWLLDEARSAAAVGHPNIAAIYEVGEADGMAFIAMELVEGQSLRERLAEGPLTPADALRFALQIAHGLARAHQGGIVHRDLKPDNVMVATDGLVKLLDFGLALPVTATQGGAPVAPGVAGAPPAAGGGQIVGTFAYMSPEQMRGDPVDARSDVYSFGVMLLEMLRGNRPKPGAARSDAVTLELPGAGPAQLALRQLLARSLEEKPEARFANGAALFEALQGVTALLKVPSHARESSGQGGGDPSARARRVRGALIATAVVLVLAAVAWIVIPRKPLELLERRLTANPPEALLEDAALSPNGQVLAYTDPHGLYLRQLDPLHTEELKRPDDLRVESLAWFPSGDALLVTTHRVGAEERHLWRVRVPSGEATHLAKGPFRSARVGPDGVTFSWIDGTTGAIHVGNPAQSTSRALVQHGEDEQLLRPYWSPDGKWLVYIVFDPMTLTLETVDVSTGERQSVLRTPRLFSGIGVVAYGWDQKGLLYTLATVPPREAGCTLWRQPMDTSGRPSGSAERLFMWSGIYPEALSVSARGQIAFLRWTAQADVYVGELEDGGKRMDTPARLTLSERDEFPTAFSPDSKSVLYTSNADNTSDIFLQALTSRLPEKIDVLGRDFKTWPIFSPAGDDLLFWYFPWPPNEEPVSPRLMRLSRRTGSPSTLLTSRAVAAWSWLPNAPLRSHIRCVASGRCVLGELEGKSLVFSSIDVATGQKIPLGPPIPAMTVDAHWWDLSPDGQRLVLPAGMSQFRVLELATGKVTLIHSNLSRCLFRHLAWSGDGQSVFAFSFCPTAQPARKVVHMALDGTTEVLWERDSTYIQRVVPSPDGKHLAFGMMPLDNDAWMLEEP